MNLFYPEDYFASDETDSGGFLLRPSAPPAASVRLDEGKPRRLRKRKRVVVKSTSFPTTQHPSTALDLSSHISSNHATNSTINSPSHHTHLAAKQRFCMEPPRPVSIDPKQFISNTNLKRTQIIDLSDCGEIFNSLIDPIDPVSIPLDCFASVTQLPSALACDIRQDSTLLPTTEYRPQFPNLQPKTTNPVKSPDEVDDQLPTFPDPTKPLIPSCLSLFDELKAIDSTSSERISDSCLTPVNQLGANSSTKAKQLSLVREQSPVKGVDNPPEVNFPSAVLTRDGYVPTDSSSSTDLDSAPIIIPQRKHSAPILFTQPFEYNSPSPLFSSLVPRHSFGNFCLSQGYHYRPLFNVNGRRHRLTHHVSSTSLMHELHNLKSGGGVQRAALLVCSRSVPDISKPLHCFIHSSW